MMKIKIFDKETKLSVEVLKPGWVFCLEEEPDRFFLKIPLTVTQSPSNPSSVRARNAVDLQTGELWSLNNDSKVIVFEANLQLKRTD